MQSLKELHSGTIITYDFHHPDIKDNRKRIDNSKLLWNYKEVMSIKLFITLF